MTKVDYRFTQNDTGNFVFRSIVNSFGLENVTDKDIFSFYSTFSQFAYQDTGLLPVNGTGLLSVRSAGNHMQIAYQYEPGMYRINWGKNENDPGAEVYHVAQPYRIVIGDFINGNFYGARVFYSLEPISHVEVPLYHVNLPNINCKGYRGNGVGWVCLYQNHNITEFPFNEKLIYLLDRCSGAEAYNDENMSETDGPRFYQSYYKNDEAYSRLWDPKQWQASSAENGYEWTLDSDLWVPILVSGIDNQSQHDPSGIPLTFGMAIFGNYAAYYNDTYLPKPINAIARDDFEFDIKQVFNWFKQSYNNSSTQALYTNSFEQSANVKEKNVNQPTIKASHINLDDEDTFICELCTEEFNENNIFYVEKSDSHFCQGCLTDTHIWSDWHEEWIPNDFAVYCHTNEEYFDAESNEIEILECPNCKAIHVSYCEHDPFALDSEKVKSQTTITDTNCNRCSDENTIL